MNIIVKFTRVLKPRDSQKLVVKFHNYMNFRVHVGILKCLFQKATDLHLLIYK